jgi:Rrf2 family iron-sulfur cluster assembly transcriptional regulator
MAMVDLAKNCQRQPSALADIADRQGISLSYLEQLFAKLRLAELVNSVRGPGGGYLLARDAADIPISDVIDAVDALCTGLAAGLYRGARALSYPRFVG